MTPEQPPKAAGVTDKEPYVTFKDTGIYVDLARYLKSPEGQAALAKFDRTAAPSAPCAECGGTGSISMDELGEGPCPKCGWVEAAPPAPTTTALVYTRDATDDPNMGGYGLELKRAREAADAAPVEAVGHVRATDEWVLSDPRDGSACKLLRKEPANNTVPVYTHPAPTPTADQPNCYVGSFEEWASVRGYIRKEEVKAAMSALREAVAGTKPDAALVHVEKWAAEELLK